MRTLIVFFSLLLLPPASLAGVRVAVMDFVSKGGIEQAQVDALSEMLANEISRLGDFSVVGKADIVSMLDLEQRRQQLDGCNDSRCLSEIGGALGVRWVVAGSVSLFGETYLLNLRLIDVVSARVGGRVSRRIGGGQDALVDALPAAAAELFGMAEGALGVEVTRQEPPPAARLFELVAELCLFGGAWGGGAAGLDAAGYPDASGSTNGDRLGGGMRLGLLLGRHHTAFVQTHLLVEHWTGEAAGGEAGTLSLRVDFDLLRLVAGYRFAWPVTGWFAPFAEAALGTHVYLEQDVPIEDADGTIGIAPEQRARLALMLGLGLRFCLLDRFVLTASYQWDTPVADESSSSFVLGAGVRF